MLRKSMGSSGFSAGISPLDEAHGRRLAGDRDGSLQLALAVLEAAPHQLGAAALVTAWLIDADRTLLAGEAAARLADGWIRRGDLPSATVAAHLADRAGEDGTALRERVAQAFGEGSPRLADVSPAPPPLPTRAEVAPRVGRLAGEALLEQAEGALRRFMAQDDPVARDAPVPKLPLFSSLPPARLGQLLAALTLREAPMDGEVIAQGGEGREAFVVARGVLEVTRRMEDGHAVTLAALGPGAIFGEMALVSDAPRAASVVAAEPSMLLAVSRAQLEALAVDAPVIGHELGQFCRGRMLANLARHSPILRSVPQEARPELIGRFESTTFASGERLVQQDRDTDGLYLIASGGVDVLRSEEGDRLRIASLGPGDVVGEISLVLRRPANADVLARHPTVALRLSRERFQQAIQDHPGLLNELYDLATRREEETHSVVAQQALDVDDVVLV